MVGGKVMDQRWVESIVTVAADCGIARCCASRAMENIRTSGHNRPSAIASAPGKARDICQPQPSRSNKIV